MMIDTQYDLGDLVYLKTDPDQCKRMVIGIDVREGVSVSYELGVGDESSWHYELEISAEKDVIACTTN